MGAYFRPVAKIVLVAVFVMPLLAASHCLEATSSRSGPGPLLSLAASDHDHCDPDQHGTQTVTAPQSKFQSEMAQGGAVLQADVQTPLNLYHCATSFASQPDLPLSPPQPSKQSLNCTFLI